MNPPAPASIAARPSRSPAGEDLPRALLLAGLALGAAWMLQDRGDRKPSRAGPRGSEHPSDPPERAAARQLSWGAAALSFSVLADSAAEHYRAGFHNPAMFVGPAVAALTLLASASPAAHPRNRVFGAAAAAGLVGMGFHAYDVSRRVGGWSWQNLFYGAPVAAPLGLTSAGLMGMAAERIGAGGGDRPLRLVGLPAGPVVALGAAAGLLGTGAEAGLFHFRGAFHRAAMYLPVTVPPLAAVALGIATLRPAPGVRRLARWLLRATAAAGLAGMGFHARGIGRSMGGWRNWRQNLLAGPPLPAPPAFTGMALAGLAGLSLSREAR